MRIEYGYHTLPGSMKKGISINVKLTSASGAELYNDNIIVEYGDGAAFATLRSKKQSWEKELKVDGNFKVTIKNNCPSGKPAQTFDTFDILSVSWISF